MHGVPSGRMSAGSTGKQVSFMFVLQQRLQAFSTKKKGGIVGRSCKMKNRLTYITHAALQPLSLAVRGAFPEATLSTFLTVRPVRHRWTAWTLCMHSRTLRFLLTCRILRFSALHAFCHVLAVLTTRWIFITKSYLLGFFLHSFPCTYLHTANCFLLNLQSLSQHGSLSSVPNKPASHSSSPSTRRFPQKLSSGSEKHRPDLACRTLRMDRRLHGENRWNFQKILTIFF